MAFDSYWTSPSSNDDGETVRYRFGSIGQVVTKMFSVFPVSLCRFVSVLKIVPFPLLVLSHVMNI